jgi:hypothetical protein
MIALFLLPRPYSAELLVRGLKCLKTFDPCRRRSKMHMRHHILTASSNLLGIALVIIAGLNVSKVAAKTFSDEIAWIAAISLSSSCLLSYLAIRSDRDDSNFEIWADRTFVVGLVVLFLSVLLLAWDTAWRP